MAFKVGVIQSFFAYLAGTVSINLPINAKTYVLAFRFK